ncbi:mRNA-binding ribosome synthesis protein nop7, partial [Tulasnella sp. 403]
MGKIQKKGEKGPNTMYITRTKALRKLQLSLNDFRRLCILKGIVPREPPNRKKANHGNSAPTAFYHVKDINFLAHEPMIQKLRDHKIFLRKMTTLLKKEEFSRARALEESRPVYKLDHIIKERQVQICLYPTFIDAVRDLDDAICCVFLGASLTQHRRIPQGDLKDCARLAAEWQLYVMHTRSLRKVFLSIKGIYYQADVLGQPVTWIVPYQFTQDIPMDVDFRVMRTFLEFYKTLLGFVFYKLYTDVGLVYPPPLDVKRDESGGSVDAYRLQQHSATVETDSNEGVTMSKKVEDASGNVVTGKDVKKTIKSLGKEGTLDDTTEPQAVATAISITQPTTDDALPTTEEFIARHSSSKTNDDPSQTSLVTLHALATTVPQTSALTSLFSPYTIFISRESPRHILEFVIKAFGGRVG